MKPILQIITLFILSFLLSLGTDANNSIKAITVMEDNVQPKINSLGLLHIGINELVADLNKNENANIQPVEGKGAFGKDSDKITEIGKYLNYNIAGTNNFIGCRDNFEKIVTKYFSDKNKEEQFYKRIDNIYKKDFKGINP